MWLGWRWSSAWWPHSSYHHLLQRCWWLPALVSMLFCCCFAFAPASPPIKGRRALVHTWFSASFHPSELARSPRCPHPGPGFARDESNALSFWRSFLLPLIGLVCSPAHRAELDMGTTARLALTTLILMFVAAPRWRLTFFPIDGVGAFPSPSAFAIIPNARASRTGSWPFLHPDTYSHDAYHNARVASSRFRPGRRARAGPIAGRKMPFLFLPERTPISFCLPVVGEELGSGSRCSLSLGFVVIIIVGAHSLLRARDQRRSCSWASAWWPDRFPGTGEHIVVTTMVLPNRAFPLPVHQLWRFRTWFFCLLVWHPDQYLSPGSHRERREGADHHAGAALANAACHARRYPMTSSSQQEAPLALVSRTGRRRGFFIRLAHQSMLPHFPDEI